MRSLKKLASSMTQRGNNRERAYSAPPHPARREIERTASEVEENKTEEVNDLLGMFHLFDSSHKGYIESGQLRQVLGILRHNKATQDEIIGEEELEQLLRDAHLEQDRKINFEEFVKLLIPTQVAVYQEEKEAAQGKADDYHKVRESHG